MILSVIATKLQQRSEADSKARHYESSLIEQAVCWCLRFPFTDRDIEALFLER